MAKASASPPAAAAGLERERLDAVVVHGSAEFGLCKQRCVLDSVGQSFAQKDSGNRTQSTANEEVLAHTFMSVKAISSRSSGLTRSLVSWSANVLSTPGAPNSIKPCLRDSQILMTTMMLSRVRPIHTQRPMRQFGRASVEDGNWLRHWKAVKTQGKAVKVDDRSLTHVERHAVAVRNCQRRHGALAPRGVSELVGVPEAHADSADLEFGWHVGQVVLRLGAFEVVGGAGPAFLQHGHVLAHLIAGVSDVREVGQCGLA